MEAVLDERGKKQYESESAYRAQRARLASQAGRDIGEIPPVENKTRRADCERDFRLFCETYHPELFRLAWSDDHIKVIGKIERSVLRGDRFAMAMPRGSGKTTLCYVACEWALLYGHRHFVVMIGAEATSSLELLDAIRTDLENNDTLLADFPEVLYPIRKLEGISHRCNGQTHNGERTQMTWTSDHVVFPTISGSKASGSTIHVRGLTGRLRGMQSKTPDGHSIRPDLVIVDDPQTDESSRSASQNDYRERLLAGAVLGLAGPGKEIAAIMPCTVINSADMADRILDRDRHPEWRGERTKLVNCWPSNTKLWEQYSDIYAGELRNDGDGSEATKFYRANRKEMDKGFDIAWPARHEPREVSAQQHAWNLRLRIGDDAFNAEYQNEPTNYIDQRPITLTADDIASKISKVPQGVVPADCTKLTAFIDISDKCLWYAVCAFSDNFTSSIIEYGTWPEQSGKRYITLKSVTKTLQRRYRGAGVEGAILIGLEDLIGHLNRSWRHELGHELKLGKILIDEGSGEHSHIVRDLCRRSDLASIVMPARGRGIKASHRPLCDGKPKPGEKFGSHWKYVRNKSRSITVHTDVNYWKTFIFRRFEVSRGDTGSLTLYKQTPRHHQMIADQITAETPKEMEDVATGNRVIEWSNPKQNDNHFLDCVVGCMVGASILGSALLAEKPAEQQAKRKKNRKRVQYL